MFEIDSLKWHFISFSLIKSEVYYITLFSTHVTVVQDRCKARSIYSFCDDTGLKCIGIIGSSKFDYNCLATKIKPLDMGKIAYYTTYYST